MKVIVGYTTEEGGKWKLCSTHFQSLFPTAEVVEKLPIQVEDITKELLVSRGWHSVLTGSPRGRFDTVNGWTHKEYEEK